MKILSRKQQEETTANPSDSALGFDIAAELDRVMVAALKPIAGELRAYAAEVNRLEVECARWSPESYQNNLNELATRAEAGDAEAAGELESGAVPSKEAFNNMFTRTYLANERFKQKTAPVFSRAAELIRAPMEAVVARGQKVVDKTCVDFGLPHYELRGWTNHIDWTCEQLNRAGAGLSADLGAFWRAFK
jgi:hypothetical protein